MNENQAANTVVYTAVAKERDAVGQGLITYSLKPNNFDDASAFGIDSQSGAVRLLSSANYESKSSYTFTVVATDAAGNAAEQEVTLSIQDLDDPFAFVSGNSGSINEGGGAGQVLYTALAFDEDAQGTSTVTYSLKDNPAGLGIDTSTGVVTLVDAPDHETTTQYVFTVVASDGTQSAEREVTISVQNVDELPPVFSSGTTATPIDEDRPGGTEVYVALTSDPDQVGQTAIRYSLGSDEDSNLFAIDSSGRVTLQSALDYEVKSTYRFTVVATDGAYNSSTQTVTLDIRNVDETGPVFATPDASASVNENVAAGFVVYTAQATDSDAVDNALPTYSLKAGVGDADALGINPSTGAVSINAAPDHETKSTYSFTVVASDAAGHTAEQSVTLTINDLDEIDPVFDSGATANAIDENTSAGTVVYTAHANDEGVVGNAPLEYSLVAGADASALGIDSQSGEVRLLGVPNFEVKSSYSFTVRVTDGGGNSATQAVSLAINDVDEPLAFVSAQSISLLESTALNTTVYTAMALDEDAQWSGGVTYSLQSGSNVFSIDGTTGVVTLISGLDHESPTDLSFLVRATDAGGQTADITVTVSVGNIDDNGPVFSSSDTANAIEENTLADAVVYTALATDNDYVGTPSVHYSLKSGVGDASKFSINGSTGVVTLHESPDYETKPSYSFTVVATDGAGLSTEQAVTLAVTNLDDNGPVFSSSGTATAIAENTATGAAVYTAVATDSDYVEEASVTYSLKDGAGDGSRFSINGSTGVVTLNESPDYETKPSYTFTVVATDGVGNTSEQAVTLAVTNVDEVAPLFTSAGKASAILENTTTGATVYTAVATDSDFVGQASITYSLKAGAGDVSKFSIHDSTGVVTLHESPNYETKPSYTFTVVATDGAGNSSERVVTLAVTNVDEVAPVFTSATSASVAENVSPDVVVYSALASDQDTVEGGAVVFSLVAGNDADAFIMGADGNVRFKSSPNYEDANNTDHAYTFTVLATDGGGNTATRSVTLSVTDVNEAPTGVTLQHITSQLPSNTDTAYRRLKLADIQIADDALGTNQVSVQGDTDDLFYIDRGDLYLRDGAPIGTANATQHIVVSVSDSTAGGNPVTVEYDLSISGTDLVPPTLNVGASPVNYSKTGATQNLQLPDFSLGNPGGYANERLTLQFFPLGGTLQLNTFGSLTNEVPGIPGSVVISGFLQDLQTAANAATFVYDGDSDPLLLVVLSDQRGNVPDPASINFSVM